MNRIAAVRYVLGELSATTQVFEQELRDDGMSEDEISREVEQVQRFEFDVLISLGITPDEITEAQI